MSKEKIYIFDTTLRDGAQTEGVNFSIEDKNKIRNQNIVNTADEKTGEIKTLVNNKDLGLEENIKKRSH